MSVIARMEEKSLQHPLFFVDDDPFFLKAIERRMEKRQDIRPYFFSSGEACLAQLSLNPSIIFLDYHLKPGGLNGIEVLKQIRREKPSAKVIILSAQDDIKVAVEALRNGGTDYLIKHGISHINVELIVDKILNNLNLAIDNQLKTLEIEHQNQELLAVQKQLIEANEKLEDFNQKLESLVMARTNELNEFIYRASHDLLGPIARIRGLLTLCQLESPEPNIQGHLTHMNRESEQMNLRIHRLIHTHHLIKEPLGLREIQLPDWMQETFDRLCQAHSMTENVFVDLRIHSDGTFFTDPYLLEMILSNLLDNALRFGKNQENKRQEIILDCELDCSKLNLKIRDNGPGIDSMDRRRVFDMFFTGNHPNSGTGLGLYMVKKALEKLGGDIGLVENHQNGCLFDLIIPPAHNRMAIMNMHGELDQFDALSD